MYNLLYTNGKLFIELTSWSEFMFGDKITFEGITDTSNLELEHATNIYTDQITHTHTHTHIYI
jgi:hypothetical protein